eukprot:SAG22_NODE_1544_length_4159_cov_2.435468_2_plen_870_part_00
MEEGSPYVSLAAKLSHSFTEYAERPCLAERPAAGAPFRWQSYREVGDVAGRLGGGLRARSIAGGTAEPQGEGGAHVVAICRKRDRWWYLYDWGAQLAGLVTVGLDNSASHAALAGVCRAVQPWCIVVDSETAEPMRRVCAELAESGGGEVPLIVYADDDADGSHAGKAWTPLEGEAGARRFFTTEALLSTDAAGDLPVHRGPDALATLVCTSGSSSGVPKAVMLSDAVWARRVYQPRPGGGAGAFAADSGGAKLWVSFQPPFHTMDRKSVWACLFVGGRVGIHQDAHGKEALWRDFQDLQPDRIVSSPAFWKQLHLDWEMAGGTPEATEAILARLGGRVHTGNVSGAKPSEALIAFMRDHLAFKKPPGNSYSSSEAHLVLSNGDVDGRNGVRVKLADVPGMYSVVEQRAGELLVSSPSMLSGYFGNQQATNSAIVHDEEGTAWYRTGDVARVVTRDGCVVFGRDGTTPTYDIVDRVSSVVKMASGEFVNPTSAEAKLGAVCTELFEELVADARSGQERIAAIVVPKPAHAARIAEELLAALRERVAAESMELNSCENVKGLVVVSTSEFAEWLGAGLLTPLGKFVRGAIAKRYAPQLDALYRPDFQFAAECRARMDSQDDVRAQLVGMIAFMLELDPTIVEQHDGHLGSLGLNSLGAAQLSATLKQVSGKAMSFCCALTRILSQAVPFLTVCLSSGALQLPFRVVGTHDEHGPRWGGGVCADGHYHAVRAGPVAVCHGGQQPYRRAAAPCHCRAVAEGDERCHLCDWRHGRARLGYHRGHTPQRAVRGERALPGPGGQRRASTAALAASHLRRDGCGDFALGAGGACGAGMWAACAGSARDGRGFIYRAGEARRLHHPLRGGGEPRPAV